MHIRVADSASDKNARRKLEEEVEASEKTIKRLKEKQEALLAAPSKNGVSASELHSQGEQDKLWVSDSCLFQSRVEKMLTRSLANPPMFML